MACKGTVGDRPSPNFHVICHSIRIGGHFRLDLFKEAESFPKAKFDNNCDVLRVTPVEFRRYLVL